VQHFVAIAFVFLVLRLALRYRGFPIPYSLFPIPDSRIPIPIQFCKFWTTRAISDGCTPSKHTATFPSRLFLFSHLILLLFTPNGDSGWHRMAVLLSTAQPTVFAAKSAEFAYQTRSHTDQPNIQIENIELLDTNSLVY